MLERGSIQGSEATAKHRSDAPFARGHLEAAVQCPALSAAVEVAHTTSRFPYLRERERERERESCTPSTQLTGLMGRN